MNKIINQIKKIKYIEYLFLTIVLTIGFIVRLYKINNPVADWHSWRQADTASVSRTFLKQGINLLYPRYQDISSIQSGVFNKNGYRFVEFPFFNALHTLAFTFVGRFSFEIWGRLISIISALISTIFIFFIGKHFSNKWVGLIASLFFLILPYNIYFTRVILPEPMGTMFALGGLWFFVKYLEKEKKLPMVVSSIFFACAALIKPFTLFYCVPLVYLLLKKYSIRQIFSESKILIPLLVFSNIVLVPLFAWRVWMNQHLEGIPFFTWAFNGDKIRFRPAFFRWIFGERIARMILGTWGLIPFGFGILKSTKKKLFYLYFLAGVILYTVVVATANVRHDYYQIMLVPAISLLLAEGSVSIFSNKQNNSLLSKSLLAFSLVMMLGMSAYQIKEFYKINHPEIIEAGQAVKRLTPEDALIIAPYNADTAFLYQTDRWGWPVNESSIEKIIERGGDYYVSVDYADKDTVHVMENYEIVEKTETYVLVDLHKPKKK